MHDLQGKGAMADLETTLKPILFSIDEVKCAGFDRHKEARPLLVCVMGKIVQDTVLVLQGLHMAVLHPELFIRSRDQNMTIDL